MKRKTIKVIENTDRYPVPKVEIGDIYIFSQSMNTRAGHIHEKGAVITVQNSTFDAPYGEISASGVNWICQTKFGTSCWSTLELCISRDQLTKINK